MNITGCSPAFLICAILGLIYQKIKNIGYWGKYRYIKASITGAFIILEEEVM
ncbi:hypothetical protein [Bacillus sp. C30]|uniref:hypothetical protein n=1 Tax=Bacillus sp. C30 TaxID=1387733 RepID=UPI00349FD041